MHYTRDSSMRTSITFFSHSALLELYTLKAYVNQMNPPKELGRQLEKCIEMSVDSWFSLLKRTVMPTGGVRKYYVIRL